MSLVMVHVWLRAIRARFLLASIISVSIGLAVALWKNDVLDPYHALLTYLGVLSLHASVDLLNDYWDYRSGIDKATRRTPFSGGTGVLPEHRLSPASVYRMGIIFLMAGALIGLYFVAVRGVTIAIILAFAVAAVYLYSTKVVRLGLGELFVAIKGMLIVMGTYYVQVGALSVEPVYAGAIAGMLSSTVLFINSFPDYEADRQGGRRTLVILLGPARAARLFIAFPLAVYAMLAAGVILGILPVYTLIGLAALPLALRAYTILRASYDDAEGLIPCMSSTVALSRVVGMAMVAGVAMEYLLR
ncbi:MAG: prenyltransferase [Candidatus Nitrosocaldus sp.]|nr:prenyltransferase [Candidatus Nitrosocaldus sp.]MCS7141879.1 prenyltransferase [Candidatus Nitrosocaldus sp.]MDW8000395.1 prenyltransferase [Candidatus Nitrosocaldus sp.]MDW8275232.1 prenyltransferase [Candidatus Nitrosocaldus sp.]